MRAFREFIIEIGDAFNNTMKHGSLELYVDHRARQQEQSNRRGRVISLPMKGNTDDVEVGAEVIIDPTVLFQQTYRGVTEKSRFLVDEAKGWYKVTPEMILAYKNTGEHDILTGFGKSLFIEPLKDLITEENGIILPVAKNLAEGTAKVVISNKTLFEEEDIADGDIIYYPKERKWLFEIDGQELFYLRNTDVLGKKE